MHICIWTKGSGDGITNALNYNYDLLTLGTVPCGKKTS